jgi:phosphate starvation-inducible PhoH-like protein
MEAIEAKPLTVALGPAGTGKTYLAICAAVEALDSGSVTRIVLSRPAVEAGENLGFLPGDMREKLDPYLRPLWDALNDRLGAKRLRQNLDDGTIEIAPVAFMRGRTLNNSFIILDEAQNTTPEQMKMFLTRIGFGSKVVVTGDDTQVDVQDGRSGLKGLERVLVGIDQLEFVHLTGADVVRHQIVADIVAAYERDSNSRTAGPQPRARKSVGA